jgi:predicted aspartyl protease
MKILVRGVLAAVMLCGLAAPCAAADNEPCSLVRAASLDMATDPGGGQVVPMTIGGRTANLLVDTGGIDSMLTQSFVASLNLRVAPLPGRYVTMFGGYRLDRFAVGHDINLGGLKAPYKEFIIMPNGHLSDEIDGTLAPDILRAYDDEFDFAGAKLNLFLSNHCQTNMAYWTKSEHAEIPFEQDHFGHISFLVTLDGKKIHATLDTGSARSIFNLEQAEDLFGFTESDPQLQTLKTTDSGHISKYPFKSLNFSGVSVANPDLTLYTKGDERIPGGPELILGMGILRQLHMYIAYKEQALYVTAASAH